jgi:hypothetical protein
MDRDHRGGANVAEWKYPGWSEERIRLELPDACGPLQVTADQPRAWKRPVAAVRYMNESARRTEDGQTAVGPVDGHRMKDLRGVHADSGAWSLEPDPIDDNSQSNQGIT